MVFGSTSSIGSNVGGLSQQLSPTQTQVSSSSASSAALFIPALTSLLGAGSAAKDIESQNRAVIANIKSDSESLNFSLRQKNAQMDDLNRAVGDRLSETGFQAMVTESRLRAASAETGASGTTAREATSQADVQRLHSDAIILRESDLTKQSLMTSSAAEILSFENRADSMRSQMVSPLSAGLKTISSGISGFQSGLSFLSESQQQDLFNTNTTGEE